MKKKILFISPLPPPNYGSAMSSKMCLEILEKSKNFSVENIKLNYSENMSDIGSLNLSKIKGFFKVKKEIRDKISSFSPDLIYFMPATARLGLLRDFFFIKMIKKGNKKILYHVRARVPRLNFLGRYMHRLIFTNSKIIVLGESLKKDVMGYTNEKNIFVLPNAIENELNEKEFKIIVNKRKKRTDRFNILFLSNMDRVKGWPQLLQACKILRDNKTKFQCNFVGDFVNKKDKEYFKKFVKENCLNAQVHYLGKRVGKEKNEILKNSDVLVFPTEYPLETFGRVIIEAMMFGLPVIANGIATIPSIIEDKKTGFVLKKNHPSEITENILLLRKNKQLREKMGLHF